MSSKSILTERDRSCFPCKVISASGMFGAAAYIGYHSRKFNKKPGVIIMLSIASAFAYCGTARIFDLPPFPASPQH